jgi:hypothetical protein
MKTAILLILFTIGFIALPAQEKAPNVFIITTDGFRWQEVFNGGDPLIMTNPKYTKDTALIQALYGGATVAERRQKLLPFFWSVIARQGQLYGNRQYGNKVDVKNPYKISYAGYNEIFTGYADPKLVPNTAYPNSNTNLPAFLNNFDDYKGKVVAFSSWNVFPYILNEAQSGFPVNSGYERNPAGDTTDIVDRVQDSIHHKSACRFDMLTFFMAKEHIRQQHPKVMILGLGETDEFAHSSRYDMYLQRANDVDKMIAELWYIVQTDPFYKDNTTFIITTDHGRGKKATTWPTHHLFVKGSGEIWLAMLGRGIAGMGEMTSPQQLYQNQVAQTIAQLLGKEFIASRPVGKAIALPINAEK